MTTSGSTDYNPSRDDIIKRALRILGVIEGGESPSASDQADAVEALQGLVKAWMATGFRLWKIAEATVFLEPSQTIYSLSSSGDHASETVVKTELAADAAASATAMTVDSITDISASDNIGIVLDDGTTHWTTVSGSPSGTTVTLATGLASAASTDTHVYVYTTRLVRPLRLRSARLRNSSNSDTPILTWSRDEYVETTNKFSTGTPSAVYYDPQLDAGELHVWLTPNDASSRLLCDVDMPIEDMDAASNTADYPQEWVNPISWLLADEMRFDFGVPVDVGDRIHAQAKDKLDLVLGFDTEAESTYFGVSLDPE